MPKYCWRYLNDILLFVGYLRDTDTSHHIQISFRFFRFSPTTFLNWKTVENYIQLLFLKRSILMEKVAICHYFCWWKGKEWSFNLFNVIMSTNKCFYDYLRNSSYSALISLLLLSKVWSKDIRCGLPVQLD